MDTPSWKKKLAAFVLVGGLAVIVFVALTMFAAGFTSTTPVTVTAQRSGLVMEPDAKVKLRGVEVGRKQRIEVGIGDRAVTAAVQVSGREIALA